MNEKEERDLKVLAAPAEDKCASFARSPAALRRRPTARQTDGRADGCEPGPRAAEATRAGSDGQTAGGSSREPAGPGRPLHSGAHGLTRPPAPARHAAGPGLRGICSPGPARPLPGAPSCAPGAWRASRWRRGAGTFRLSRASPERVYERSVPAVADDDAAPAGE